ncbi:MAG: ATP-binding protein, partial [Beijerinckiaceae bacterium]
SLQSGPDTRHFQLAVALDHNDGKNVRSAFSVDVAKILALLALLLVGGAWLQMRFGLRPLKTLRASLNAVREGRAQRLNGAFPNEVAPLVDDLNTLLNRQDNLVRKARDRAGILAHGLKTPLTILSREASRLERSGQTATATLLREQCAAMRAHVERELARARTHGAIDAAGMRTTVRPILERLIDVMQRVDGEARIQWHVTVPDTVHAAIETSDFAEIVGNLLDNARKWARSAVEVSVERIDGRLSLCICDDGPGVPEHNHHTIMRRGVHFGRTGDQSTGLGLAIVSDTLAEYGSALIVRERSPGLMVAFPIEGGRTPHSKSGLNKTPLNQAAE